MFARYSMVLQMNRRFPLPWAGAFEGGRCSAHVMSVCRKQEEEEDEDAAEAEADEEHKDEDVTGVCWAVRSDQLAAGPLLSQLCPDASPNCVNPCLGAE